MNDNEHGVASHATSVAAAVPLTKKTLSVRFNNPSSSVFHAELPVMLYICATPLRIDPAGYEYCTLLTSVQLSFTMGAPSYTFHLLSINPVFFVQAYTVLAQFEYVAFPVNRASLEANWKKFPFEALFL